MLGDSVCTQFVPRHSQARRSAYSPGLPSSWPPISSRCWSRWWPKVITQRREAPLTPTPRARTIARRVRKAVGTDLFVCERRSAVRPLAWECRCVPLELRRHAYRHRSVRPCRAAFADGSLTMITREPQLGKLCQLRRQGPRSAVRPGHWAPLLTVVDRW
jgi:hypothetical protein